MLTAQQLTERLTYIGSSDASAIVGMNPWRSAWDVWAEKTELAEPFAGNDATNAGDRLEDAILQWAADELGCIATERAPFQRHARHWFIAANIDALARTPGHEEVIIEAKTHGICSPARHDEWGEAWTDEVPDYYRVQVQHQLAVTGLRKAFLAALLPSRGFVLYAIRRDEEAIEAIVEAECRFWELVVTKQAPEHAQPSIETLKRIRRKPKSTVDINTDIVSAWVSTKDRLKAAQDAETDARAAVLLALDSAEVGTFDGGQVTYFETCRKAYSVEATKYRTLKLRKANP